MRTGAYSGARRLSGGAARDLFDDVVGADWCPDGRSIALVRAPGWRHRLEFPAGKVVYETDGMDQLILASPRPAMPWPFSTIRSSADSGGSVALIDRDGRKSDVIGRLGECSGTGLVTLREGGLVYGVQFREQPLALCGHAHRSAPPRRHGLRGVRTLEDISTDGRILLNHSNERVGLIGLGADSKPRNLSWLDWSVNPILS